jgi:mannose-6-phosphate isomerase-like protein (cupin superfamily)
VVDVVTLTDERLDGSVSLHRTPDALVAVSRLGPRFPRVPLHVHPRDAERIAVRRGVLEVRVGRTRHRLRAGEELTVPAGVAHTFATREPVEWVAEFRPGGAHDELYEGLWRLARRGLVSARGFIAPWHAAPLAWRHFDDVRLARVPARVQRALIRMVCSIGGRG